MTDRNQYIDQDEVIYLRIHLNRLNTSVRLERNRIPPATARYWEPVEE